MTQSMTVTLSLPPKALSPNARPHWAAKARATKAHRGEAFLMTQLAVRRSGIVIDDADDVLIRPLFLHRVRRRRDRDNALASLKAALDGVAEALGVDDSRFVVGPVRFSTGVAVGSVELKVECVRRPSRGPLHMV
jgi:crossover junction endodeoxyribonuclease RusA